MRDECEDLSLKVYEYLSEVQKNLNAPKNRRNTFGNYNYRNCEDILEAVKKIMPSGCTVTLSDKIWMAGERYYILATATFSWKGYHISSDSFARESLEKKGMDAAMCTGAASSYARKYALNGLFAIDDSKDIDSEDHSEQPKKAPAPQQEKANPFKDSSLITKDQEFELSKIMFESKTDSKKFCDAYKVKAYSQLTKKQYEDAMKKLNSKMKKPTPAEYLSV